MRAWIGHRPRHITIMAVRILSAITDLIITDRQGTFWRSISNPISSVRITAPLSSITKVISLLMVSQPRANAMIPQV